MDVQIVIQSLVDIFTLSQRPCPDPSSIKNFEPDLTCIRRDADYLFMQVQPKPGELPRPDSHLDGGDSDHRTGVLAFCGSSLDKTNLPKYVQTHGKETLLVRHPNQSPWNNPWNCTRDQLIGYLAGCWRAQRFDIAKALFETTSERVPAFTFQSREDDAPGSTKELPIGDFLLPENIMYFKVCYGEFSAVNDLLSQTQLYISILIGGTDLGTEINQLLLTAIVCGQLDVFVATHTKYKDQLRAYWGTDTTEKYNPCIAEDLIEVVNLELARYNEISIVDRLLPQHLWNAVKDINVKDAFENLAIANPVWVTEMTARLAVAALKDVVNEITALANAGSTLTKVQAEVQETLLVCAKTLVGDVKDYASKNLGPVNAVIAPALQAASCVLSLLTGSSGDDAEEESFRAEVISDLGLLIDNTKQILDDLTALDSNLAKLIANYKRYIDDDFTKYINDQLTSEVEANSTDVKTYRDDPTDGNRLIIEESIHRCNQLIIQAMKAGPEALPCCLHAFTLGIYYLSVVEDQVRIRNMRSDFAPRFKEMYRVRGGLQMQETLLNQEIADREKQFGDMLGKKVLVVLSTQHHKAEVREELEQIDDEPPRFIRHDRPFIVPVSIYDVQAYSAVFTGTIGDIASISAPDISSESMGTSDAPITPGSDKAKTSPLSPNCIFDEVDVREGPGNAVWYSHQSDPANAANARNAQLKAMVQLSSDWSAAKQSLRQVTALSLSVRSTFGF